MNKLATFLLLAVFAIPCGFLRGEDATIHISISCKNRKMLEQLLKNNANVNATYGNRYTPLLFLLQPTKQGIEDPKWNIVEIAGLLLEHGANPNVVSDWPNKTPLLLAAEQGNGKMMDLLLKHGADINQKGVWTSGQSENTALHAAIVNGNEEVAKLLLSKGADVNAKGTNNATPLHHAVRLHLCMVKWLVSNGADVNVKNRRGETPLHIIASMYPQKTWVENHREKVIESLVEAGVDLEAKNRSGNTSLGVAAENYFYQVSQESIKILSKHGADFENINDVGLKLIAMPASYINKKLKDWFDENIPDVNKKDKHGTPLLHKAVIGGKKKIIEELLSRGVGVNAKNRQAQTALHLAVSNPQSEIIDLLIKFEADVNARDNKGKTPLHYLAKTLTIGEEKIERKIPKESFILLLSNGAKVDIEDKRGYSPLKQQQSWGPQGPNGRKYKKGIIQLLSQYQGNVTSKINTAKIDLYHEDIYARRKAAITLYYHDDYSGVPIMIESLKSSDYTLTLSVSDAVLREITSNDFSEGKSLKLLPKDRQKEVVKKWMKWWGENKSSIKADKIDRNRLVKVLKKDSNYRQQLIVRLIEREKNKPGLPEFDDSNNTPQKTFEKFIVALRAGDDAKALSFMTYHSAKRYKKILKQMDGSMRQHFFEGMGKHIFFANYLGTTLSYNILVEGDDGLSAFPISFVKEGSGNWIIVDL